MAHANEHNCVDMEKDMKSVHAAQETFAKEGLSYSMDGLTGRPFPLASGSLKHTGCRGHSSTGST